MFMMVFDASWARDRLQGWLTSRRRRLLLLLIGALPVVLGVKAVLRAWVSGISVAEAAAATVLDAVVLTLALGLLLWWSSPVRALTGARTLRPVEVLAGETRDTVRVIGEAGQVVQWRVGRSQCSALPPPGERVWATEPVVRGAHIGLVLETPEAHCGRVIQPRGPSWHPK